MDRYESLEEANDELRGQIYRLKARLSEERSRDKDQEIHRLEIRLALSEQEARNFAQEVKNAEQAASRYRREVNALEMGKEKVEKRATKLGLEVIDLNEKIWRLKMELDAFEDLRAAISLFIETMPEEELDAGWAKAVADGRRTGKSSSTSDIYNGGKMEELDG